MQNKDIYNYTPQKSIDIEESIEYKWITFKNISVNEIILNNIVKLLSSKNKKNKKIKTFKSWINIYKISKSWYRLLELPREINSEDIINEFLEDSNSLPYHNYCWYFIKNWLFYIIASEEIDYNNKETNIKETKTLIDDIIKKL